MNPNDENIVFPKPTPIEQQLGPSAPTLGTGLSGMTRAVASGITQSAAPVKPSVITAESAKAAVDSGAVGGGVVGSLNEGNAAIARANKATGEMIDGMIAANGGNGVAVLPEATLPGGVSVADWNKGVGSGIDMRGMGSRTRATLLANMANNETQRRGQDMNFASEVARQGVTTRGQDLDLQKAAGHDSILARGQDIGAASDAAKIGVDRERVGVDKERVGIMQGEAGRSADKWGIEKKVMQGNLTDAEAIRSARGELTAAIATGDPVKVAAAREKAIAAGVKFDKPNNEFTSVTDSMGLNVTRTNKDTGQVDIINPKTGEVRTIAAPGAQARTPAPAAAIDYLKKNPDQSAAFKAKYGYLPEGF